MTEQTGQQETPQPLCVSLIIDERGSMASCTRAAIAGFNQDVKALQDEPAPTWFLLTRVKARRTAVRYRGVPVAMAPELDVETDRPQATTPLDDAIGHTLAVAHKEALVGCKKLCGVRSSSRSAWAVEETTPVFFFSPAGATHQEVRL